MRNVTEERNNMYSGIGFMLGCSTEAGASGALALPISPSNASLGTIMASFSGMGQRESP